MIDEMINKNEYLKIIISKNPEYKNYLKIKFKELKSKKIKNINSLLKKLKEVNTFENLKSLVGHLNFSIFFSRKNFEEIDIGGKEFPSGRACDIVLKWNSKTICVEIKSLIKKLELELADAKPIFDKKWDKESIETATREVLGKDGKPPQLSENEPNILAFDLGHSLANVDDFESVFEHLVTKYPSREEVRREGLFFQKTGEKYLCELISGVIAIKDFHLIFCMSNPNVKKNLKLNKEFFKELKN